MKQTYKQMIINDISALIYLMWLSTLVWLFIDGRYRAFIQPKFSWLLVLGAVILLLYLHSCLFWPSSRNDIRAGIAGLARTGILILPLIFIFATYGQGLGTHALTNKSVQGADAIEISGLFPKDTKSEIKPGEPISLLTLVRNMEALKGQRVIIEGMIYQDPVIPPGGFLLFRFGIFCCAADAIPIWVIIQGDQPLSLPNDSWVRVEGLLHVKPYLQKNYPVIKVDKIKEIPTPAPGWQYLFF